MEAVVSESQSQLLELAGTTNLAKTGASTLRVTDQKSPAVAVQTGCCPLLAHPRSLLTFYQGFANQAVFCTPLSFAQGSARTSNPVKDGLEARPDLGPSFMEVG